LDRSDPILRTILRMLNRPIPNQGLAAFTAILFVIVDMISDRQVLAPFGSDVLIRALILFCAKWFSL